MRALVSIVALFLTSCSLIDAMRVQKNAPVHRPVDVKDVPSFRGASESDPPAEVKFQNIRVLKGLPSSQLYSVMAMFSNSLGVTCSHCHTEHFQEESKQEKEMARDMIRMTRAINQSQFQGEPTVTCYTCHHGKNYPDVAPPVSASGWHRLISPRPPQPPLPELSSVRNRYESLSAAAPLAGRGEISTVGGLDERASGNFEIVRRDGRLQLQTDTFYPPPLDRALTRYANGRVALDELYGGMTVLRRESVGGRDALVVMAEARDESMPQDRLAFDAETGQLLRVQTGTMTQLGFVPEEIEFRDFTASGTPRTIQWGRGDYMVVLKFD